MAQTANDRIEVARSATEPTGAKIARAESMLVSRRAAVTKLDDEIAAISRERGLLIQEARGRRWSSWIGAKTRDAKLQELADARDKLKAPRERVERDLFQAHKRLSDAKAAHQAAAAAANAETDSAQAQLGSVAQSRAVLALFPFVAFAGPQFFVDVCRTVEKARESLRNPSAVDIWGLPIAGPGG